MDSKYYLRKRKRSCSPNMNNNMGSLESTTSSPVRMKPTPSESGGAAQASSKQSFKVFHKNSKVHKNSMRIYSKHKNVKNINMQKAKIIDMKENVKVKCQYVHYIKVNYRTFPTILI